MKPPLRPDIRRDLVARAEAARRHYAHLTRGRLDRSDIDRVRHGDFANARLLRRVVAEHGWPGRTLVGDDGADAAWLIALYADVEPELQRRALRLLATAVERGEAAIQQWAHLYDRCSVNAGKRQLYGTQYQHGPAGMTVLPILGPAGLDNRRASVGLPPFAVAHEALRRRHLREPVTPESDRPDADRDEPFAGKVLLPTGAAA
ncbi:DUF6624 domain-containing protein [Streptomyces sp. NPDC006645]|uniref:DUF6624 domain-containing protein n=1 Tax=unclassified Streptomyces TaxID=2593676 RepID=UPI0033A75DF2